MKKSLGAITLAYPSPVFLVGSYDEEGKPNVMNAAWGGICCSEPPCIAVSVRSHRHTHHGIVKNRAFTISIPNPDLVEFADYVGIVSGKRNNKFEDTGLTPVRSEIVNAPYIKECPVVIELELLQTVAIGTHDQFIGWIKDVKVEKDCLDEDGKPDIIKINPLLFDAGQGSYFDVGKFIAKAFNIGQNLRK